MKELIEIKGNSISSKIGNLAYIINEGKSKDNENLIEDMEFAKMKSNLILSRKEAYQHHSELESSNKLYAYDFRLPIKYERVIDNVLQAIGLKKGVDYRYKIFDETEITDFSNSYIILSYLIKGGDVGEA